MTDEESIVVGKWDWARKMWRQIVAWKYSTDWQ